MIIPIHIRYADVPCRFCGADATKPCRGLTGYNYDYRYSHAIRRRMLWALQRRREQEAN